MISVVICSADPVLLAAVTRNIEDTIGVPHEILAFDNGSSERGICEIYNEGLSKARYDLLCFMHEDVLMRTVGWGNKVIELFAADVQLGLLGIAGGYYKAIAPSGWTSGGIDTECSNLIQHFKYKDQGSVAHFKNPFNTSLAEVACVDGVWFCTRRSIARAIKFDENTFKGFHCYDIDFSLAAGLQYKVAVSYQIMLEHLSEGKFDAAWLMDVLKLNRKWRKLLPVNKGNLTDKEVMRIERVTFKYFIQQLKAFNLPLTVAMQVLWTNPFRQRLGQWYFLKFNFYIIRACFSKRRSVSE